MKTHPRKSAHPIKTHLSKEQTRYKTPTTEKNKHLIKIRHRKSVHTP